MTVFHLPDLGEGLQEAEIVTWHVSVGDHVVADQPLVAVETEKAVVEIPAPQSGRIAKLCGQAGDVLRIGDPLVEFGEGEPADEGTVVGKVEGAAPSPTEAVVEKGRRPSAPSVSKALPAVRALANRLGVELSRVAGSGPGGRITASDVEKAARSTLPKDLEGLQPLRGVRRSMARNMSRAHAEVVPATVTEDADINGWAGGQDPTMRLVRAVARACEAEPALNAWYDGASEARRFNEQVDLGIAMDTEDGLFVPVLRDAGNRDVEDLRRGLDALRADVKARTVPPGELRGQTITLSNFGMIAGRYGALVIVPPQVAILGAGRIAERVVATGGQAVVRRTLPLSLTFDHRAVTGGEAARFLSTVIADLEYEK